MPWAGALLVLLACGSVEKKDDGGTGGLADGPATGGAGGADAGVRPDGGGGGGAMGGSAAGGGGAGGGGHSAGGGAAGGVAGAAGGVAGAAGAAGAAGGLAGGQVGGAAGAAGGGPATGGLATGGAASGGTSGGGSAGGGAGGGGAAGGAGAGGTGGAPPLSATWSTNATAVKASSGSLYSYNCPAGGTAASVWGTDAYTTDSSICTAAVHAGLISLAAGGIVTIQVVPGFSAYSGSLRNGITTNNWTAYDASFRFPAQTTWATKALSYRGNNGLVLSFVCPPNGTPATIWGTDVYTDDSPVCTAAVHAGLISLTGGGTIAAEILAGQSSYLGSTRNGITSTAYGVWQGSVVFPH